MVVQFQIIRLDADFMAKSPNMAALTSPKVVGGTVRNSFVRGQVGDESLLISKKFGSGGNTGGEGGSNGAGGGSVGAAGGPGSGGSDAFGDGSGGGPCFFVAART